jgi:hypothetical protein
MPSSWERAYREYLNGHNGHGDPLSFEEFRGRLSPLSGEKFSKPEKTPAKPPIVRQPEPNTSDDPLDYDLNAEGSTGALVPANSKKKTPFANPHYQTRTDKPLAGRNQGKAEREGVYRPDNVGKIEEYRATGHATVAGKHVSADGLVSRSGYRRVPSEELLRDNMERDSQIEDLKRLAESVLRGRNRKIFTRRVIEPLDDLPGATFRELADQYGISVTKVHRIIGDCHMRIAQALEEERTGRKATNGDAPPRSELVPIWLRAKAARREESDWSLIGHSKHHYFYTTEFGVLYKVPRKFVRD